MKRRKRKRDSPNVPADTTPLRASAASFRTHVLQHVRDDLLAFRPALGFRIFAALFVVLGGGILAFALLPKWGSYGPSGLERGVVAGMGGIFLVPGLLFLILPRRFEFERGAGELRIRRWFRGRSMPLDEVAAIQLIPGGWHKSGGEPQHHFYTYQLNLVLRDGARINLSNHGNWDATWETGSALAEFLGVPFQDEVSEENADDE